MLRHPYLDMTPQRSCRRLDLIKARGMGEIEQPIHLLQMPAQTARQFSLLDPLLDHRPIHAQLGALQRRRANRGATLSLGRHGKRLAGIDVKRQRGFQRVYGVGQRLAPIDGLGNIGEGHNKATLVAVLQELQDSQTWLISLALCTDNDEERF